MHAQSTISLLPRLCRNNLSCLADVVKVVYGDDEARQVLFLHLKAHTESSPAYFEVAEGALAVVEVHFLVIQLPHVGLQKPRQEGISWVSDDAGRVNNDVDDEIGDS